MGLKVVVTGASSGIGRAAVLKFSSDGHDVYCTARSADKLSETEKLAQGAGHGKVHKGVGDVGVEADVQRHYGEAMEALGGEIDVLVLNAGSSIVTRLEDTPVGKFDTVMNTNVRGVFLWLKAALPAFKKRGAGQIVIINSIVGEAASIPNFSIYTASKFAVRGMTEALRLELQGSGIKLASICPGVVDSAIYDVTYYDKSLFDKPLREAFGVANTSLSSEDIAEAIATISYQSSRSDIEKIVVWPATQRP